MSIISLICFIGFVLLLVSFLKKESDPFSPGRLFLLIWFFAIGLTDLKLSQLQIQWTSFSWTMLYLALFSFLTGIFIVYVVNFNKPLDRIIYIRYKISNYPINSNLLYRYIIILFMVYLISFFISYLVIGFLPYFTKYPGLARTDWGIFGFGLLIQAFPSIIYMIVLYYLVSKKHTLKKIILALVFGVTFISYGFFLQRYYIIFVIIVSAISLYYCSRLINFKNVLIITAIVVSIIYSMTFIRLSTAIANYLYYLSRMKFSIKYAFLTEPYMYIVMNLENFANAVDKMQKFTYGIFSFDFLFALTGIKHPLVEYLHLSEYPNIVSINFNTYTMFFIYYRDFGVIGLALIPLFIGMIISMAYYNMRRNPNLNTISMYAILAFVIIFSFFVPIISFLHFMFNLLIIFIVTKTITLHKKDLV